jgi:acetyl-CoA acetyltransferase
MSEGAGADSEPAPLDFARELRLEPPWPPPHPTRSSSSPTPAPRWALAGRSSPTSATELGATAVKAAVERAGVSGEDIDKIFMGCVLPAGLGQAPARQAALKAGLPRSVEATTVNKVCGSGMQAVMFAHDMIAAGSPT